MTDEYDVAIVGAGIIGLGAAYAAVQRGQRVVVIDRTAQLLGASIRNFGHACIGAQSEAARPYAERSRALWLELAGEAGFWARECGTAIVARSDAEADVLVAAGDRGFLDLVDGERIAEQLSLRQPAQLGGWLPDDLQVNPREAANAIAGWLEWRGVHFMRQTSVRQVVSGQVETSRGSINAETIVVAVNHDLDQLLPDLAEHRQVQRCSLDMLRVELDLAAPLPAPVFTGWSLVRYGRFAEFAETQELRAQLHREHPALAALDLNQMYTQLPDGTVLVGDTHTVADAPEPFQFESAANHLLAETEDLFGARPRVIERWQGVYAKAPEEFLVERIDDGVLVLAATTGIGMTCGLGLAELELNRLPAFA